MKIKVLLLCLLLPTFANSMETASRVLKPLGVLAASWLTVLIAHEAGHAVPGKIFFNEPINIHLASDPRFDTTDPALFNIGPFHVHGLPIFGAVPGLATPFPKSRREAIALKLKMLAINAGGPVMGSLAGIGLGYILNAAGVSTHIPLFISMLNMLNLIPLSTTGFASDGCYVWENIKDLIYLVQARKTIYDIKS